MDYITKVFFAQDLEEEKEEKLANRSPVIVLIKEIAIIEMCMH